MSLRINETCSFLIAISICTVLILEWYCLSLEIELKLDIVTLESFSVSNIPPKYTYSCVKNIKYRIYCAVININEQIFYIKMFMPK